MKILEVSFEVCNKVGGIYTVISSKAQLMSYQHDYFVVGPYKDNPEFNEIEIPDHLHETIDQLGHQGIKAHYGTWQIKGEPRCFLLDIGGLWQRKNELKTWLWDNYKIDSIHAGYDFEEPMLLSYAAAQLAKLLKPDVVHSHEWMLGMTNLFLSQSQIKTMFTTHATILGRTFSAQGTHISEAWDSIHPDKKAIEFNIQEKHSAEKAALLHSDISTTVSEITAQECEHLLGKRPIVIPNALDMSHFIKRQDHYQSMHNIKEKVLGNCQEVKKTLHAGVFGRFEIVNKGMDITIEVLAKIKEKKLPLTCYFCIPMQQYGPDYEVLDSCAPNPVSTHYLEQGNPLVDLLHKHNLLNHPDDSVNVIIIPLYLDGNDKIIPLTYYEALQGINIGLFPSFYEPFGYTPLECAACSVPAVTSDLAGFGDHVKSIDDGHNGVYVLPRKGLSREEIIEKYVALLETFIHLTPHEHENQSKRAKAIAKLTDWQHVIQLYFKEYENLIN